MAARLIHRISYKVQYKTYDASVTLNLQFILTNDKVKMERALSGIISKISTVVTNFLINNKLIGIDKNPEFIELFNNFDTNYSLYHKRLDDIFQNILTKELKNNSDTVQILDNLTYVNDQTIVNLITGSASNVRDINAQTVGTMGAWNHTTWSSWTGGEGHISALNPEDFIKMFRKNVKMFDGVKESDNLYLGNFNFNLSAILIAGVPLSGLVASSNDIPVQVTLYVSADGLHQKLLNYANIIIAFYKYFEIESAGYYKFNTIKISQDVYNKIVNDGKLLWDNAIKYLRDDFKVSNFAKDLDDINLFTLGNRDKVLGTAYLTVANSTTLQNKTLKEGGPRWRMDFLFGDLTFNNSIFYTPWTATYFKLSFQIK
ncbi:hypothetical protein S100390_v1c04370 [Spiroplasma sp. NBRC 100390]|uniref:hypothetical protein n=1 Tax=unclassified Spiroplasma TaxID=2637901 RepID=UPI0008928C70|nr:MULTISPECIES: hypothetical protein [unclassified Spiroplasma]AOX43780.1 hypothetical protein STU14_v1c04370 [Spiroplasma sp. TU-14]APE13250.1 hypothetical protein S100390_v1c04370 [Spiroplasma sp. NBRC 100390]